MLCRLAVRISILLSLTLLLGVEYLALAQKKAAAPAKPGELTVDRIYDFPSLNGHLARGIAWTPDSKRVTFFEPHGTAKNAKPELWVLDTASGERSLLIPADKFETILPAPPGKESQATGLGRHAPSQYQWAPSGDAILFESAHSLVWYDPKAQTGRVLVTGKAELGDPKISPDGKYVSFVREHNLWLVGTVDGKERALTTGGSEEIRKGELD